MVKINPEESLKIIVDFVQNHKSTDETHNQVVARFLKQIQEKENNLRLIPVLDKGYVELMDYLGDDNAVVSAARVSHLGESKGKEKDDLLIAYLADNKHTSPFEHVIFKFKIKCPLFIARQWMRHRTWSYNEVSRRYTSEDIQFYIPDVLFSQSTENKQAGLLPLSKDIEEVIYSSIEKNSSYSYYLYEFLLSQGLSREQARIVLPLNLYTTFIGTVDLHNLVSFIKLRTSSHAQYEIRLYANAIKELIEPIVPVSLSAWIKQDGK